MTKYMLGGRRRIDRVLAPEFLDDLSGLVLEEVRARRMEADQEEVDLSYARRLLQGRIDILRAEEASRGSADGRGVSAPPIFRQRSDQEIVDALAVILSDDRREARGLGRHLVAEPSRVGEHRREAEAAVADVGGSDLSSMDEDRLAAALDHLGEIEARTSEMRRRVQEVLDALTRDIARRYAIGEVSIAAEQA